MRSSIGSFFSLHVLEMLILLFFYLSGYIVGGGHKRRLTTIALFAKVRRTSRARLGLRVSVRYFESSPIII